MHRKIIIDIEFANHLEKECFGDVSKLQIGVIGVKHFEEEKYEFFDTTQLGLFGKLLQDSELIIGHNLVGHNGLDFKVLENNGINTKQLFSKTFDTMTACIRTFGSFKSMGLDSISKHTFNTSKKKFNTANYKLIRNGEIEKVKENLKTELTSIENLFLRISKGQIVKFKTSVGHIDEHEMSPLSGFSPEHGEKVIEPYDFPIAGMRLQIKNKFDENLTCDGCSKKWHITSASYFGDTMNKEVKCPNCETHLTNIPTSMFMPEEINETQ